MKNIKTETINKYSVRQLARFIDRASHLRVDLAYATIYEFDRERGAFLFCVTIADHNIDTIREIAHSVNLELNA